jgi:hypothetical protein
MMFKHLLVGACMALTATASFESEVMVSRDRANAMKATHVALKRINASFKQTHIAVQQTLSARKQHGKAFTTLGTTTPVSNSACEYAQLALANVFNSTTSGCSQQDLAAFENGPDETFLTNFCTSTCLTSLQTAAAAVDAACTATDPSLESLSTAFEAITLACIKDDSNSFYCLPRVINAGDPFGALDGSFDQTAISNLCDGGCVKKFLVAALSAGVGELGTDLTSLGVLLDAVCLKIGGEYCAPKLSTIEWEADTPDFDKVCHPCVVGFMNKFFEILSAVEELEEADQSCKPGETRYCAGNDGYACCREGAVCTQGSCQESESEMEMEVIAEMFTLMCTKDGADYCGNKMGALGEPPSECSCDPGPTCAPCCGSFLQSTAASTGCCFGNLFKLFNVMTSMGSDSGPSGADIKTWMGVCGVAVPAVCGGGRPVASCLTLSNVSPAQNIQERIKTAIKSDIATMTFVKPADVSITSFAVDAQGNARVCFDITPGAMSAAIITTSLSDNAADHTFVNVMAIEGAQLDSSQSLGVEEGSLTVDNPNAELADGAGTALSAGFFATAMSVIVAAVAC